MPRAAEQLVCAPRLLKPVHLQSLPRHTRRHGGQREAHAPPPEHTCSPRLKKSPRAAAKTQLSPKLANTIKLLFKKNDSCVLSFSSDAETHIPGGGSSGVKQRNRSGVQPELPWPHLAFLNSTTSHVPRPGRSPVGTCECQVDWEGP